MKRKRIGSDVEIGNGPLDQINRIPDTAELRFLFKPNHENDTAHGK